MREQIEKRIAELKDLEKSHTEQANAYQQQANQFAQLAHNCKVTIKENETWLESLRAEEVNLELATNEEPTPEQQADLALNAQTS